MGGWITQHWESVICIDSKGKNEFSYVFVLA